MHVARDIKLVGFAKLGRYSRTVRTRGNNNNLISKETNVPLSECDSLWNSSLPGGRRTDAAGIE